MVGSGFAANFHLNAYAKISGVNLRYKTLVATNQEKGAALAQKFGFEKVTADLADVLRDPDIDLVDIVTPPNLLLPFALQAVSAGKHAIAEKPLVGYFGAPEDKTPIGRHVSRAKMFDKVLAELDRARAEIKASGKFLMYAENYIYSPNVQKAGEIIRKKKSKLLFMKGEESIRGSVSPVGGRWDRFGGGSLIRLGCHPIAGMLWLKRIEAQARNERISISSVIADTGNTTTTLGERDKRHLTGKAQDVEDFATSTITFSDGTKALAIASDNVLGGVKNYIEIYASDCAMICNITPTDNMRTYFLDQEGLEEVYISEKMNEKIGWNDVFIAEDVLRGYTYELQDFVECAASGREPLSGIDLACETVKTIYASYLSASEGRRVTL